MPTRQLDFEVFDADNHMYETRDALTRHLPDEYAGIIRYVEVDGRTKIAVGGRISDYIPNPTFDRVAAPGAQEDYYKNGNPDGKSRREIMGRAIEALPAFREPGPRLALMDEQGIDRALMWPTLASLVEERLRDDPDAIHAVVHALNRWMHDEWSFNYEDRIFAVPVVTLPILEKAIEELEWVLERGARIILIRPAPVPGFRGPRSFALPEFDPFWQLVQDADVVVGMHASDSGYQRYLNEWEGVREGEFTPFRGVSGFAAIIGGQHREITDTVASAVGHGLCTRFPRLKIVPVENGSGWVRPLIEDMRGAYEFNPHVFEEDPVEVLRRNVFVHPFHEDDTRGLIDVIGVDNVLFGSDFPHPEGMSDPISFVDELDGCSPDVVAKVMGGNLGRLMNVA
ncbi:amidohydrolase family protein [Dermatobacter hominis]|uniref:amidohydrolase family protein n=1 Tax=Dermatobacter hominis TaxID=2884263 RepID=UPI001D128327|nr:amidohydrolase family protein [Dermatobacter hominis]UDY35036.1 amidohydrolase [Dermatobacter hominis]